MTELSGSFNARAAGVVPKSPAVPTLIMVIGLAVTLGLTEGLMSRIASA